MSTCLSTSSRFSNLLAYRCSYSSLTTLCFVCCWIYFLVTDPTDSCLSTFLSCARVFYFVHFLKYELFDSLNLCIVLLIGLFLVYFFPYFAYFFILILKSFCRCFPISFRCTVNLFVLYLSNFLM